MGATSNSTKVGLTVVIAAVMIWGGFSLISNFMSGEKLVLYVRTDDAKGISDGMAVKLMGTDVGFVDGRPEHEDFTDPLTGEARSCSRFKLVVLAKDVRAVDNDFVCVTGLESMLGGYSLELESPKVRAENPRPVKDGDVLQGVADAALDDLLQSAANILAKLEKADFVATMNDISAGLLETMENANTFLLSITDLVQGNEAEINASLGNLQEISENFLALSRDMREISTTAKDTLNDPTYRRQFENMLANMDSVSTNLTSITTEIESITGDEQLQSDLKESVSLTRQTLEEARATLESFQGTMDNVNLLIDDGRELVEGMNGIVDDASGLMDGAGQALDTVNNFSGSFESRATFAVRAIDMNSDNALNNDDVYIGDMNLALGDGSKYLKFGADRIGAENEFNFLFGYGSLEGFSLQGGVYRSELGFGASYGFRGGGLAEVVAYDTDDPKVNATAHIPVAEAVNVILGVEDAENEQQATVGVEIEL